MADTLKHRIVSGVFWQGLERIGSQGISFVISIVLARLLAPEEFGVIAIIMIFTALCGCFVDSGFGSALIQKQDITEADCSSVFYINIAVAFVMYGLLFLGAPWIAMFYHSPQLSLYLRFSALVVVIRSFSNVQLALLNKRMLFHLSFRINWVALLISGATGIILAYCGLGVWALIAQQLSNAVVTGISLWLWVKWHPQWLFDWSRAKELFQFGWKLFVSALLDTLYNDIYSLTIGKIANLTMLSYYNRGKSIPNIGMGSINSTLGSVLFPAFSEIQSDREKMRLLAKRGLQNIMFAVVPALTLLFVLAEPLVKILLTEKWLPCVIFLRLCCIEYLFWPLHTTNLQIITACGRSDVFLILEIIKKIQCAVMIFATYRYGVTAMVIGACVLGFFCAIENGWINRKLINYAPWTQLWDLFPMFLIGVISGSLVFLGLHFIINPWLQLFIGGGTFAVLYLLCCGIFRKIPPEIIKIQKAIKI